MTTSQIFRGYDYSLTSTYNSGAGTFSPYAESTYGVSTITYNGSSVPVGATVNLNQNGNNLTVTYLGYYLNDGVEYPLIYYLGEDFLLGDSQGLSSYTIVAQPETLCFLRGTRILTPRGAAPVEDLRIGETVVTRFGGIQRIKWLGRQSYAAAFVGNNPERWPVCIKAGALADGVPARDLFVSPGHSMLLGDVLVLASSLVNGVTVTQMRPHAEVGYVQIELEGHDCVIAEGAWAETFADAPGLRAQFHNADEFYAMYPDAPPPEGLRLCAARPEQGGRLAAALLPVVERAEEGLAPGRLEGWVDSAGDWKIAGWARDVAHPGLPVRLEVLVGERVIGTVLACEFRADLAQAGKGRGRCAFRFTPPVRLGPAEVAALTIRRAADGAALPGTERFREASAA